MSDNTQSKILNIAAKAAEILLENGSEIYRVEQSVCKIINFFGFKPQCFATLTCIIITIEDNEEEIVSLVRRVNSRTTHLDKVYKVSFLIKNIKKYNMDSLNEELDNIRKDAPYSFKGNLLASCSGAAFFSILFSGNLHEFSSAFIAGCVVGIFSKISNILKLGTFFHNLMCGFALTSTVCFLYHINFITQISIPIISTLMLLVPGVAFINSMRDIFEGDLVTGVSRLLEVLMVGTSIAIGSGIALNLFYNIGGKI
ncbi:MAG: hypothetical protein CR959_01020 [Fusobacteriales bacterium]|nr:MAG: hypothetical protein CR959_01020 [Fusobacteriales bacterium]